MTHDILRKRARLLRDLVTIVFAVLTIVLAIEVLAVVTGHYSVRAVLGRLPVVFYLAAIWMVRTALASIARGVLFDAVIPRLISRIGVALAAGALANVFVVPLLWRAAFGHGGFAYYDPAAITLGVAGFALILLARLLAQAAEMRAELDEMF